MRLGDIHPQPEFERIRHFPRRHDLTGGNPRTRAERATPLQTITYDIQPSSDAVVKRGSAQWAGQPLPGQGIVEEERDHVMTELLRVADARLRSLDQER